MVNHTPLDPSPNMDQVRIDGLVRATMKQLIDEADLSQSDVAVAMDMTPMSFSRLLNTRAQGPTMAEICGFEDALHLSRGTVAIRAGLVENPVMSAIRADPALIPVHRRALGALYWALTGSEEARSLQATLAMLERLRDLTGATLIDALMTVEADQIQFTDDIRFQDRDGNLYVIPVDNTHNDAEPDAES